MHALGRRSLFTLFVLMFTGSAFAQVPKSAALAKDLVTAMEAGKLSNLAAKMADGEDTFAAVMYSPGLLMVVSGRYASPPLMAARIAKKDYQEAYIDLQSSSTAGSRLFVQDVSADGLRLKTVDNVESDGKTVLLDGQWKKQKFASEQEYQKAIGDLDERYTKALEALVAAAKRPS